AFVRGVTISISWGSRTSGRRRRTTSLTSNPPGNPGNDQAAWFPGSLAAAVAMSFWKVARPSRRRPRSFRSEPSGSCTARHRCPLVTEDRAFTAECKELGTTLVISHCASNHPDALPSPDLGDNDSPRQELAGRAAVVVALRPGQQS